MYLQYIHLSHVDLYTPIFSHAKTEVRDQCHSLSLFFSYQMDRFWASTPSTWLKIKSPTVSTRFCSSSGLFSNCSARNIKQPKQQMPIIDIEVLNFPHERCFGLIWTTPFFHWFWGCCLGNDGCWTCMNMFDLLGSSNLLKTILKMETVQQDFREETKNDWKKNTHTFQRFRQFSLMRLNRHQFIGFKWRNLRMVFSGPHLDVKHFGIWFSFTNHSTYLRIIIKPQNSRTNRVNSTPH